MIILDTSIWIEFFKRSPNYYEHTRVLLENEKVYALEFIFGELLVGSRNKKESEIILDYWNNLPKFDISNIWIKAGKLSSIDKLYSKGIGLIDCAIIVAAKKNKAKIWSLDKQLNNVLNSKNKYIPSFS